MNAPRGRDRALRYRRALAVVTRLLGGLPRSVRRSLFRAVKRGESLPFVALRFCLARTLLGHCGENVYLGFDVTLGGLETIRIGDNTSIHHGTTVIGEAGVRIGSHVSIAHGCSIVSVSHTWGDPDLPIRDNVCLDLPVTIGDDVWIGCGVRILAGVTIGTRVVIAAGAVVTADTGDQVLVGGVPARVLKQLG